MIFVSHFFRAILELKQENKSLATKPKLLKLEFTQDKFNSNIGSKY